MNIISGYHIGKFNSSAQCTFHFRATKPEKAGGSGSGGENLYLNRYFFNAGTVERKRQWRGMQSNGCSELEDCLFVTLLEFLSYFFVFSMLLIKKNDFYLVKGNSIVCTGFLRENHHLEEAARRK